MTKKIKGNLILKKDTRFEESIEVEGDIICKNIRYNLTVVGNIHAWDIHARDIDAWDIHALDIHARDIDAWDIHAWDIHARDIDAWDILFCESIDRKRLKGKIKARVLIEGRSNLEQKEFR